MADYTYRPHPFLVDTGGVGSGFDPWDYLIAFENVDRVADLLVRLHKPARDQLPNMRKQARHIRYCIRQANQYYRAAQSVSDATRAVSLYYCCQAFALAEILIVSDGNMSLDKAREIYSHHGLTRIFSDLHSRNELSILRNLKARVERRADGSPLGVFGAWLDIATHLPIVASTYLREGAYNLHQFFALFTSENKPVRKFDTISLHSCLNSLPSMMGVMEMFDPEPVCGRFNITARAQKDGSDEHIDIAMSLQPTDDLVAKKIRDQFIVSDGNTSKFHIEGQPKGFTARIREIKGNEVMVIVPDGLMFNRNDFYSFAAPPEINEFGYFYVGLFILSMLARYFQDFWMHSLDVSDSLSMIAINFMKSASSRVPLLALSHLERRPYLL